MSKGRTPWTVVKDLTGDFYSQEQIDEMTLSECYEIIYDQE